MDYPTKSSASRTEAGGLAGRADRGFSLVELLIATSILSLVLAGTYSAFYSVGQSTQVSLRHVDQSSELQFAFESVLRSMRAVSQVHQTDSDLFEFTTVRMDGSSERIRYAFDPDGRAFVRTSVSDGTSRKLIGNVTHVLFTYYDRFGEETATQIDMNAARLQVTSEREGLGENKSVDTETAMITFRNKTL